MKRVGFLKSDKENEKRICLLPEHIKYIKNKEYISIEKGYGNALNIDDNEYINAGVKVKPRNIIMQNDIIVDPKIGDATYINKLKNQTIFGWIHAVQNKEITDTIMKNKLTAFAWEDMFELNRHVFWRNNEVAGEAAVMHAILLHGIMPYNSRAAILGNGNASRGAYRVLTQLGCKVNVYSRKMESIFKKEMADYDIIVNAVLWDINRKDYIISRNDIKKLKKGTLIIDISCDHDGAIETSHPTTINKPTYFVEGIEHYAVDHTPSLVYRTVSLELSSEIVKYIDYLIEEDQSNNVLKHCKIFEFGEILDKRIIEFQQR